MAGLMNFFARLFTQPTSHSGVQFIRYGMVAVVAFVVDFGLLYVFTSKFHIHYLISTTSAFAISVVVNYILSTWWVFAKRTKRQRSIELALFIGICVVALGLNDLFMWIFTSLVGIHYLISKLITVALVFFWSFGARRFLFHPEGKKRKWLQKYLRTTLGLFGKSSAISS